MRLHSISGAMIQSAIDRAKQEYPGCIIENVTINFMLSKIAIRLTTAPERIDHLPDVGNMVVPQGGR